MKHEQLALFQPQSMPAGFRYAPDLIDAAEEARLVAAFADLPFKEFAFHGFLGKRRVVSFGFRYDFNGGGLTEAEPIPSFLLPVRERAAVVRRPHARPPAARSDHRIPAGRGDRLASRPGELRRRDRRLARLAVHLPDAPPARQRLGARRHAARPPLGLSHARPLARRMGAQHPRGGCTSLLDHVPVDAREGVARIERSEIRDGRPKLVSRSVNAPLYIAQKGSYAAFFPFSASAVSARKMPAAPLRRALGFSHSSKNTTFMSGRTRAPTGCLAM